MQPNFDPNRKTTSKQKLQRTSKQKNGKRPKKNEMEDDHYFLWLKTKNDYLTKKGRQPQKKILKTTYKKCKTSSKTKMEDNLKNGRQTNQPKST
jgi:hypothetical protein